MPADHGGATPRVNVVVPCFNTARYVAQAIASVRAQSLSDWECVVVDDGSTDGSAEVATAAARDDRRVRVVQQPNGGVAAARNAGLARCLHLAEYVLFLDADDSLEPSMLQRMIAYLDAHPEVGMAYCKPVFIDESDRVLPPIAQTWTARYAPSRWWVRELSEAEPQTPFVSIFCLAGMVPSLAVFRRSAYDRAPGWDESFGQPFEDTNLFLNMALVSEVHLVAKALVSHRRHPAQNTAQSSAAAAAGLSSQQQRLYERWRRPVDLGEAEQATVASAWRFHDRRLVPAQALTASCRHLGNGWPSLAVRFLGRAAITACRSFVAELLLRAFSRPRSSNARRRAG